MNKKKDKLLSILLLNLLIFSVFSFLHQISFAQSSTDRRFPKEIAQEPGLTTANRIRLIPTQIFFDAKNQEVLRHEGFMGKDEIKKVFQKMGGQ